MSLFPMFLKLEGRLCLVVGAGSVGESKIEGLLRAGGTVRVIAPRAEAAVAEQAAKGLLVWDAREFQPSDLDGMFLVVVATSSEAVNEAVFQGARSRNVLCNVVDDPQRCDFYYPAVVQRGKLQLAISTEGQSPALAQKLRRDLEVQFGPEYETWVDELGELRKQMFASLHDPEERKRRLHELVSHGPKGGRN